MKRLPQADNDVDDLNLVKAVGSQHADPDVQLLARVVARLLSEKVSESTEADFRAGMAKGEYSSNLL